MPGSLLQAVNAEAAGGLLGCALRIGKDGVGGALDSFLRFVPCAHAPYLHGPWPPVSTENVLIEDNIFNAGHGVAIGSETSGWIRDVVVRNSTLNNVEAAVRIKSCRGRGGGVERVSYGGARGTVDQAIQINLNYKKRRKTNASATPIIRNIDISDFTLRTTGSAVLCAGLVDSIVTNISVSNISITGSLSESCMDCEGTETRTSPKLCFARGPRGRGQPDV